MPLDKRDHIIEELTNKIEMFESRHDALEKKNKELKTTLDLRCALKDEQLDNYRIDIENLKTRIDELKDEASDRSTSFMETDDND